MERRLFERFAAMAYEASGIRLASGKEALVAARIARRVRALGLAGAEEYLEYLTRDERGDEIVHFLDVISTNFTSFFREADHFRLLEELVRERARQGRERLRLWSAASSSGEEPYTMALVVSEALGAAPINWRILATDISTRILGLASRGIYPEASLKAMPRHLQNAYFAATGEQTFQVRRELRDKVVFRRLNLSKPPFPMRGPLDAVFCRNVMIYFDRPVRQALISDIERLLAPDGILFIGHSESLNGLDTRFRALRPSVYGLEPVPDGAGPSSSTGSRAERALP